MQDNTVVHFQKKFVVLETKKIMFHCVKIDRLQILDLYRILYKGEPVTCN